MKAILLSGMMVLLLSTANADVGRGKALHDESCMKCHDTGVYTREDRFIQDTDALTAQVERCQMNVGVEWNGEQVEDVVQYLNRTFYKFQ